ncbi:MAG: hypothetical protein WA884_17635 [Methyloceanibacter sp.]|jgi:hypothetical protein
MDQTSGIGRGANRLATAHPALGFSLLRLSVLARLAMVAVFASLLWASVLLWALA